MIIDYNTNQTIVDKVWIKQPSSKLKTWRETTRSDNRWTAVQSTYYRTQQNPQPDRDQSVQGWTSWYHPQQMQSTTQMIVCNIRKFNRHNDQCKFDYHWDFQYHTCFNIGTAIRKTCKQVLESKAELIPAEQLWRNSCDLPTTLIDLGWSWSRWLLRVSEGRLTLRRFS